MNRILQQTQKWLLSPKPFFEHEVWSRKFPILCGLFVILFLIIFTPFGITFHSVNVYFFIAGFGIIAVVINEIIYFIVERIPDNKNWKMYQTLPVNFITLSLISVVNWIYFKALGKDVFGPFPQSLLDFFIYTYAIGAFPTLFFIFFNNPGKNNQRASQEHDKNHLPPAIQVNTDPSEVYLTIHGDGNKEHYRCRENELLYVKAEGNYVSVFFLKEKKPEKMLIRSSLKRIEEQLSQFPDIVRCHRSYIINTLYVSSIVGNARGRSAKLFHTDKTIPLSRSFPIEFAVKS